MGKFDAAASAAPVFLSANLSENQRSAFGIYTVRFDARICDRLDNNLKMAKFGQVQVFLVQKNNEITKGIASIDGERSMSCPGGDDAMHFH